VRGRNILNVGKRKVMSVTNRANVDDLNITLNGIRIEEVDLF
jgi:hypothetical protein